MLVRSPALQRCRRPWRRSSSTSNSCWRRETWRDLRLRRPRAMQEKCSRRWFSWGKDGIRSEILTHEGYLQSNRVQANTNTKKITCISYLLFSIRDYCFKNLKLISSFLKGIFLNWLDTIVKGRSCCFVSSGNKIQLFYGLLPLLLLPQLISWYN